LVKVEGSVAEINERTIYEWILVSCNVK